MTVGVSILESLIKSLIESMVVFLQKTVFFCRKFFILGELHYELHKDKKQKKQLSDLKRRTVLAAQGGF